MSEVAAFISYYDSIDWVVGKARVPMTNWRAAMGGWKKRYEERRNQDRRNGNSSNRVEMTDPAQITANEIRERNALIAEEPDPWLRNTP